MKFGYFRQKNPPKLHLVFDMFVLEKFLLYFSFKTDGLKDPNPCYKFLSKKLN